jgi:hypothetical protein
MTAREIAADHHTDRARLAAAATSAAREAWRGTDPAQVRDDWPTQAARLATIVAGAQLAVARQADSYVREVLDEQDVSATARGRIVPEALAGIASDGRDLVGLLIQPAVAVTALLDSEQSLQDAFATGLAALEMMVRTQVADAGRAADSVATVVRPAAAGYTRITDGSPCSQCAILAGRWYRWNAGFERHPSCGCQHVPTGSAPRGLTSNPMTYFRSLSAEEQDKTFGQAAAQAIRDGADISQVVNAERGMRTATLFGRDLDITLEGTTRRGIAGQRLIAEGARLAGESAETVRRRTRDGDVERTVTRQRVQIPRLMPEEIYRNADDRDDAIRLLKRFGYIL